MNITNCSSCQAPIFFLKSETGANMPMDADPVDDGKGFVIVENPDDGSMLGIHVSKASDWKAEEQEVFQNHFATCSSPQKHRRTAGEAWIGVLVVGVWSMLMIGLGTYIGASIVKGYTTTEVDVMSAVGECAIEVVAARAALDSVDVWIHRLARPIPTAVQNVVVADGG